MKKKRRNKIFKPGVKESKKDGNDSALCERKKRNKGKKKDRKNQSCKR